MNATFGADRETRLRQRIDTLARQLDQEKMRHGRTRERLATLRAELTKVKRQIAWMEKVKR